MSRIESSNYTCHSACKSHYTINNKFQLHLQHSNTSFKQHNLLLQTSHFVLSLSQKKKIATYLSYGLGALAIFGFIVCFFVRFNKKMFISHPKVNNMVHGISTHKYKPACQDTFKGIPVVDLTNKDAKTQIVRACMEVGFFKVINHGISLGSLTQLEEESVQFFNLPQQQKENSAPSTSFGYGQKNIGLNGDTGSLEYLLFNIDSELTHPNSKVAGISKILWGHMKDYVDDVRKMTSGVLDKIADEMNIGSCQISKMINDVNSDSCFRVNYYPENIEASSGHSSIGFGEHTDPQIISVIRSNNTTGLQISLSDDTWVSVQPDHTAFFFLVGDIFQVLTNGRFKSVKHRVLSNSKKSRVSMIYFGGPIMDQNMKPLVMEEGEESLYKEFTWIEYKTSAYKTKLGDNRLSLFEKSDVIVR